MRLGEVMERDEPTPTRVELSLRDDGQFRVTRWWPTEDEKGPDASSHTGRSVDVAADMAPAAVGEMVEHAIRLVAGAKA